MADYPAHGSADWDLALREYIDERDDEVAALVNTSGAVNVLQYGAVPGAANSATSIQAAITAAAALGAAVYFPKRSVDGDYKVTSALSLPAGTRLISDGAILDFGTLAYLFVFDGKDGLSIDGLNFKSTTAERAVLHAINGSSNISLRNIRCYETRLFVSNVGKTYSTGPAAVVSDVHIDNVRGTVSTTTTAGLGFIEGRYINRLRVSNVTVTGHSHGIMWWGGNSNPATDGALTNTRYATNIQVVNCHVTSAGLGGIWGSMGENVTITNCIMASCGDVGIDVEGCFAVTISGCVTRNCANGGIAVFYYNRGVTVTGCTLQTTVAEQWLFAVYNSVTYSDNRDINVVGCTFEGLGVLAKVGHDSGQNINITACIFRNARLVWDVNNNGNTEISNCSFLFDVAAGAATSFVQLYRARSRMQAIRNCHIESSVTQPATSIGLRVDNDDFGGSREVVIDSCQIIGFPVDAEIRLASGNAGFTAAAKMSNCLLDAGIVNRVEGTTFKSSLLLENNYRSNNAPYPAALPTTGKWDRSQIIKNPSPTAGGSIGWICTTGGRLGDTAWAVSTAYALNDIRLNGANVYQVTTAGTSAGSGGPTGTGTGIVDGSVTWKYIDTLAVFKTYGAVAA